MKKLYILLYSILFISTSLFALQKTVSIPSFDFVNYDYSSSYVHGSYSACMEEATEYDNMVTTTNANSSGNYITMCNNVNPDSTRLNLKKPYLITDYSANPRCTSYYYNDSDRDSGISSYHLGYYEDKSLSCEFECVYVPDPNDGSEWNEDECRWIKPCINPDGNTIALYDDIIECSSALQDLSEIISATTLACGCPGDTSGLTPLIASSDMQCKSSNSFFSQNANDCVCSNGYAKNINTKECELDKNNNGVPDSLESASNNTACTGVSVRYPVNAYPNISLSLNSYSYVGKIVKTQCIAKVDNVLIDSVATQSDTGEACEDEYCFVHYVEPDCNFAQNDYIPVGEDWEFHAEYDEMQCINQVDGITFINASFKIPDSTNCPDVAFCFLQTPPPDDNVSSDPDHGNNSSNQDINNTLSDKPYDNNISDDLKPILEANSDTNKYLEKLNDKIDVTNDSLLDINDRLDDSNDILNKINSNVVKNNALNQNMLNSLNQIKLNSASSLSNQYKMIASLNTVSSNSVSTNSALNRLIGVNKGIATNIDLIAKSVDSNTKSINDSLMTDINPFADVNFSDGSESFGAYEQTAKDGLSITYKEGLFNLSSVAPEIPTFSFVLLGETFTLLSPAMFNDLPIQDIRNLFLFVFALMGFVTVIRTI